MTKATRDLGEGGFSLIELIGALGIVTVGLFGVFQMYHYGLDRIRTMREISLALTAIDNEIETLRAGPFDALQDGEAQSFVSDVSALEDLVRVAPAVTIRDYGGNRTLKEVEVSVRWTSENGRRITKTASTLIGGRKGGV